MMFAIVPVFIAIITVIIFCVIIAMLITNVKTYNKNNKSPKLTVSATVMNKRQRVHGDHARTTYYVTFEYESGDRQEFNISGQESGMLVEGDQGRLTFKGTRFLEFHRN